MPNLPPKLILLLLLKVREILGYIVANNESTVNVSGKINFKGKAAINANADTTIKLSAKTKTDADKNGSEDNFVIAVGVIDGTTNAKIDINTDEFKAAQDVDIKAIVTNNISNTATATSKDNSTNCRHRH